LFSFLSDFTLPASKSKNDIMLTKEKIAEILRESYPYLMAKYGIKRLGLFGSYAKGEQNEATLILWRNLNGL
jgi:hypothetical protein